MNPKFNKFVEDHPNMSLIGLAWACQWRLSLVITAVYLVLAVIAIVIGAAVR